MSELAARGDRQEPGHREEVEQKHPGNEKVKFYVIAENLTKAFRCLNHLLDHSRRVGVIHVALVSVCIRKDAIRVPSAVEEF